jgi:tetratricopeptide (TPR) repeat protein
VAREQRFFKTQSRPFVRLLLNAPGSEHQNNLGNVLMALGNSLIALGDQEGGITRLEESVASYRAALDERTHDKVPPDWATTQNNLGAVLILIGERDKGTLRLEESVKAYGAALEERQSERVPFLWATSYGSQGVAMMLIADRTKDRAVAETAVTQIAAALDTLRSGGHQQWAAYYEEHLPKAQAIRDRLKGK